jgi:hypothetical protein
VKVADLYDSSGNFRVVYEQNFTGGGPQDQYGHGPQVSGIIAGNAKWSTCRDGRCTRPTLKIRFARL